MNVAALSNNDAMYNFVKLVDAARQRNISAFDGALSGGPKTAQRAHGKGNAAQVTAFKQAFTKSEAAPVQGTSAGYQLPKVTRTKILGNFFDAYA
jgi:hypothetical protein